MSEVSSGNNNLTVIRCISLANGEPGPAGQYLSEYDTETGISVWDPDPAKAMTFNDRGDAFEFYLSVLPSQPRRPSGEPNRPLTAFTVQVATLAVFARDDQRRGRS